MLDNVPLAESNEENGWCGHTLAHRDASPGDRFDYKLHVDGSKSTPTVVAPKEGEGAVPLDKPKKGGSSAQCWILLMGDSNT